MFLLCSCGADERFKETTTIEQFKKTHANKSKKKLTQQTYVPMPTVQEMGVVNSDYLLGPGDLLVIKVFESEDLYTEARINSRGDINLPLLDDISVLNLTVAEAEKKIEDFYEKDYIHEPHVIRLYQGTYEQADYSGRGRYAAGNL